MRAELQTKGIKKCVDHYDALEVIEVNKQTFSYIYKVASKGTAYIVKGQKMSPNDPSAVKRAMMLVEEHYLARIISIFTSHVVHPKALACEEEGKNSYVETISEFGGIDLLSLLKEGGPVALMEVFLWMKQSAEAMCVLHGLGIAHFDLKPSNMVIGLF